MSPRRMRAAVSALAGAAVLLAGCSGGSPGGASTADGAGGQGAAGGASQSTSIDAAAGRLVRLEHRRQLIEDANDIKRLQRIYGYYLDHGLWDEMAGLFADDGTLEIGLDGVYVGPERIRAYLAAAYGDGSEGLGEGRLNQHMQLMPVISVAPDGQTARGRWRDLIMLGRYGQSAHWGEGPFENEYVKEDGVWKLASVHWFQSVLVPYADGWRTTADSNGGHWAPSLTPDRPATVEYETWPGTYLPPFHFPNPVLGATPARPAIEAAAPSPPAGLSVDALAARAARLAHEVERLEDENAIENLQRIYGYYIDEGFWTEAASLFTDDGTIEFGGSGVYVGRDRVRAFLGTWGTEFPQDGRLFDRMQLQPVIHVAADGRTARGRWRLFAQEAEHGDFAHWGVGVYENTYAKVDGQWRIRSLHAYPTMYTTYEAGWGEVAIPDPGVSAALPPDRPPTVVYDRYPAAFVPPFHFDHPVTGTGDATAAAMPAADPAADLGGVEALLDALDTRVGRLEDFDALERLNSIYGYYLARNEWDNLTGIFADDGTIEIAMRGVYAGSASIRRNLNLYGEAGIHHGLLHNHMQYQPVIHIADDGRSALMRSRAFSIMGQWDTYAMWMGGVYENRYVQQDGIWKLEKDQQINTYFVPYDLGWRDAPPRSPPGITAANPPDSPPTLPFEMYPAAFLAPFHYPNPVTGARVVWEPDR